MPQDFQQTVRSVHGEQGEAWLRAFPAILASCEEKWGFEAGPPFELSYNYVAPVQFADGREAVLKLSVPSAESRSEIAALLRFGGAGAARVLDTDPEAGVLLLERVRPGGTLHALPEEEAVKAAAEVMNKLRRPYPPEEEVRPDRPFPAVNEWFERGWRRLRERFGGGTGPLPEPIVRLAEERFDRLRAQPAGRYLLHGDLHHGNILSAKREPWLAIDPKGLIGEAEYEPCSFFMNRVDESDPVSQIRQRARLFSKDLNANPKRLLEWAFCHAVLSAWWHVDEGTDGAQRQIALARHLDEVLRDL